MVQVLKPLLSWLVEMINDPTKVREVEACMACNAAIATGDLSTVRPHRREQFIHSREAATLRILVERPITRSTKPCPLCGSSTPRRQAVLVVPHAQEAAAEQP